MNIPIRKSNVTLVAGYFVEAKQTYERIGPTFIVASTVMEYTSGGISVGVFVTMKRYMKKEGYARHQMGKDYY